LLTRVSLNADHRPRYRLYAAAALLFGGTLLLFSRMVGYGFVNYDDPRYILHNPYVQQGFTWAAVKWAFIGNEDYWHPLTWLSHVLDWRLYSDNAAGHHLTNALWHALNASLAFLILRRLTGAFWTSVVAAALFAWHPLRVESVAWVTERKDVMSGCFFLLMVWAYVSYAERRREGLLARRQYLSAFACFIAGLMCKPTLVTAPLVLLALDYWPAGRLRARSSDSGVGPRLRAPDSIEPHDPCPAPQASGVTPPRPQSAARWRAVLLDKIPFVIASVATAITTVLMQQQIGAFTLALPLSVRLANAPVAIARYVGKSFWPANLSVCYPHPGWWPIPAVAGAALLVVGITLLAWRVRNPLPWLLTGWLWFLALLLPTLGLVQVGFQSLADRYTYLPALGLELAVLWSLRPLCATLPRRIAAASAAALVVGGAAVCTWQQQAVWRDSETLFRHAIAVTNRNDMAEAFLAYTLVSDGKLDEAADHCRRALAANPRNEMAVYLLAGIDASLNRTEAAISGYRRSLELSPGKPNSEYELGLLLLKTGRRDEAVPHLQAAARAQPEIIADNLRHAWTHGRSGLLESAAAEFGAAVILEPDNAQAHLGLGRAQAQLGHTGDAISTLRRALALKPAFPDAHVELGFALLRAGEPSDAATEFRAAQTDATTFVAASIGLAEAEEQRGNRGQADEQFKRALQAAPNDADAHRAWAEMLARRGLFRDALPEYQRAVELRPGDPANQAGLGYVLYLTGRRREAAEAWKAALRINPNFPGLRERLAQLGE
jgi:tetratricopeptide (TPR) repeat protein